MQSFFSKKAFFTGRRNNRRIAFFFRRGARPGKLSNATVAAITTNKLAQHINFSGWKLKSFPYTSLLRRKSSQAVYKFFDFRAWKLFTAQQTIKFKKFKNILLKHFFKKKQLFNAVGRSSADGCVTKKSFLQLQTQIKKSFSFFWFSNVKLHFENNLLYFKKKRFSSSFNQRIIKRLRYRAIYNYKHFYSKLFFSYLSAGQSSRKNSRRAVTLGRSGDTQLLRPRLSQMKKKDTFATSIYHRKKSTFLNRYGSAFCSILKNNLKTRAMARINNYGFNEKKISQKRVNYAFFNLRKLFFSNDRILPSYNFVLILTATNSNMYANVTDVVGKTIFYHTMRRVGFQTGGSSKRSSRVAVERLGIFVGRRLKTKQFFNKRFLVIFRGISWRRRFILKYIRFGARRKIKIVGIVERSGLPHNGCKLKKRKHKRKSFLRLHRIKKKLKIRTIKRVFTNFAKRPIYLKKKTQRLLETLKVKKAAKLKYVKVFKRKPFYKKAYIGRVLNAIKVLRTKKMQAKSFSTHYSKNYRQSSLALVKDRNKNFYLAGRTISRRQRGRLF